MVFQDCLRKMKVKFGEGMGTWIPNGSDAGVFKVRISLVWRQFQLRVGHAPAADCCLP